MPKTAEDCGFGRGRFGQARGRGQRRTEGAHALMLLAKSGTLGKICERLSAWKSLCEQRELKPIPLRWHVHKAAHVEISAGISPDAAACPWQQEYQFQVRRTKSGKLRDAITGSSVVGRKGIGKATLVNSSVTTSQRRVRASRRPTA